VPGIDQGLSNVVMRCLAQRPERRPQSGSELARLLGELLSSNIHMQPDVVVNPPLPVQPLVVHVGTLILSGVPDGATITLDGVPVSGLIHKLTLNDESQPIELLIQSTGYERYERILMLVSGAVTEHAVLITKVLTSPKRLCNILSVNCPLSFNLRAVCRLLS
jgi:hypothetical protein